MVRRILLCGATLGAFALTLALASWHDGWWGSRPAPPTAVAPQPRRDSSFALAAAVAPAASPATSAPPDTSAAPVVTAEPQIEPDASLQADDGESHIRRGRERERGSRSH
jgi:hypothetical protein